MKTLLVALLLLFPSVAGADLLSARLALVGNNDLHPKDFDKLTTRSLEAGLVARLGPAFGEIDFPLARAKQPRDFKLRVGIQVVLLK